MNEIIKIGLGLFGFISFISDHPLAVGIGIVILFLLYKFFVEPIVKEQNRIGGEENE